jgi:hypothetical protein
MGVKEFAESAWVRIVPFTLPASFVPFLTRIGFFAVELAWPSFSHLFNAIIDEAVILLSSRDDQFLEVSA